MKNITVTIDDDLYRLARIRAAEAGTTVTGLVRAYLTELSQSTGRDMLREQMNEKRERLVADIIARGGGLRASDNLSRDQLYDRDALR